MLMAASASAQFKTESSAPGGLEMGEGKTQQWKIGISITAVGGACAGITGYVPVPMQWPEQEVREVEEDISSAAKISYRTINKSAKMMVVKIGHLASGQTANVLVTFEVTHRPQLPPEATDQYVLPNTKKMPREVRQYLKASPKIETKDPKIRNAAKEIKTNGMSAWEQVETIYDWVRDKVKYKRGPQKSAVTTLKDSEADCEGMTALFIALCRAKDIPARTVWVQGHCYPEFYLEDKQGKGYWLPCQISGEHALGGIPETRPIFQKGDNFRQPGKSREHVHYLHTFVEGNRMAGKPRVRDICEAVEQ